jgi:hypothetical protein
VVFAIDQGWKVGYMVIVVNDRIDMKMNSGNNVAPEKGRTGRI